MKTPLAISTFLLFGSIAAAAEPATRTELNTLRDKSSYSLGLSIGRNLKAQDFDIDIAKLAAGIADAVAGNQQLTDEEINTTMEAFEKEHTQKQVARMKAAAEKNKQQGDAFLAENKKKRGVITTNSGLQYEIIKQGTGAKPGKSDVVTTHYKGELLDGTEFDSSHKRGQPATFPVDGVIPGWTEALQLMPVGSKWKLFVPAELGYGAQGAGPAIGPNATLVFEVELLGIGKPEQAPGAPE